MSIRLIPEEWCFKNEGAYNVVLAFQGPCESPYWGHVLRLRKLSPSTPFPNLEFNPLSLLPPELLPHPSTWACNSWTSYIFAKYIVSPLLGASSSSSSHQDTTDYIQPGRTLAVTSSFLAQIDSLISDSRPAHRRNTPLDLDSKFALLLPDFSLPDFSLPPSRARRRANPLAPHLGIEIKPKWGFLPFSLESHPKCLHPDDSHTKARVCRYCLHQRYKHLDDERKRSEYCPLDLFSADAARIRRALGGLFRNPENNFRIFWKGQLCVGDGLSVQDYSWQETYDMAFIEEALEQLFITDPILSKIRQIQLLDSLDISRLYPLFEEFNNPQFNITTPNNNCTNNTAFPSLPRSLPMLLANRSPFKLQFSVFSSPSLESLRERRAELIRNFLISTSLKDCSIFITFSNPKNLASPSLRDLTLSVHIIDLDVRDASRIPSLWRLDKNILQSHLLQDFPSCIP